MINYPAVPVVVAAHPLPDTIEVPEPSGVRQETPSWTPSHVRPAVLSRAHKDWRVSPDCNLKNLLSERVSLDVARVVGSVMRRNPPLMLTPIRSTHPLDFVEGII